MRMRGSGRRRRRMRSSGWKRRMRSSDRRGVRNSGWRRRLMRMIILIRSRIDLLRWTIFRFVAARNISVSMLGDELDREEVRWKVTGEWWKM